MKNKLLKSIKIIVSSVVAIAIVVTGSFVSSVGAKASEVTETETTCSVQYLAYGADFDYTTYLDGDKAPAYNGDDTAGFGYLFGGWYVKDGDTYTAITGTDNLPDDKTNVVAKFVPSQVLSVKCQNWAGTKEGSDNVLVRVISAVDTKSYEEYGFVISKIVNGEEIQLGTYNKKDVYTKFNYYKNNTDTKPSATYVPKDLFGNDAGYFISCLVGYIGAGSHGEILCIKPYWKTLDGTTVYGLSKFAHVEDGYLGYVNVPINLNILSADKGAAAGLLSVKCKSEGLTFLGEEKGIEYGKVFDEMTVNVTSDGTIKCVGNTSDAKDKTSNDIYVNLKFQRNDFDADNYTPDKTFFEFTVEGEEFCNSGENLFTENEADVWNIKY